MTFTPEVFRTIFEGTIAACVIYMTQDYIRFRFQPPYPSKEQCAANHQSIDGWWKLFQDRIENRIDRLEGLIMLAYADKRVKGDGNFLDGHHRMDAPG